ncbi:hypothetical protein QA644_34340 (plasmid) [Rhizobium sp. CC1099]|uniref:hypothetical protein n=1 Tax=Rhizobium sp. CC1099 TaxID=3039160 RepID=UPI0024B1AFF5|nr:hypothetical protein [Rhizobium sp. CC1099]WFU91987.1 hypothetical protein QA644_34340 [Rhizobium sp. CC1099]
MRPGALFAKLWARVEPHERAVTLRPWKGWRSKEFQAVLARLESCDDSEVPLDIMAYLDGNPPVFDHEVNDVDERAFVVMCAVDRATMRIHPSGKTRHGGRSAPICEMLSIMRSDRTMNGSYAELPGKGFVLPKGLLMLGKSQMRGEDESGTSLAHQFSHLSFVPHPGRHYSLKPLALPPSRLSVEKAALDRVGLAPIAVDRHDLEFTASDRGRRAFLDTAPKSTELGQRIKSEVTALLDKHAGLIVLPELVTSDEAVEGLSASLQRGARSHQAMILVGSGPTKEIDAGIGRPFNEAVVMSATGDVLFRQRKLNSFNMRWERMQECDVPRAKGHESDRHMEDCATGQELIICDILGLGRVMVLICEDLEQQTPGGDVALHALPDWVLTPVLDVGLAFGRWEHQRSIEIGRKSQSRFVVSCSAILEVRRRGKEKLIDTDPRAVRTGFCLDGSAGLRVHHVETGGPGSDDHMVVEWTPETWEAHRVVQADH